MDTIAKLISKAEDAFGFAIPDEDARKLNTVGRLYEYILARRCHDRRLPFVVSPTPSGGSNAACL